MRVLGSAGLGISLCLERAQRSVRSRNVAFLVSLAPHARFLKNSSALLECHFKDGAAASRPFCEALNNSPVVFSRAGILFPERKGERREGGYYAWVCVCVGGGAICLHPKKMPSRYSQATTEMMRHLELATSYFYFKPQTTHNSLGNKCTSYQAARTRTSKFSLLSPLGP